MLALTTIADAANAATYFFYFCWSCPRLCLNSAPCLSWAVAGLMARNVLLLLMAADLGIIPTFVIITIIFIIVIMSGTLS